MENVLNEKECKDLIEKYRNGDLASGEKLFQSFLAIVDNVASNRVSKSNYDYAMLFRIGKDGLWNAIKNYDFLNNNFRSFAITCVSNKIDTFIKNNPNPVFNSFKMELINNIIKELHLNVEKKELLEFRYTLEKLPKSVKTYLVLKFEKKLSDEEIIKVLKTNKEALDNTLVKITNMLTVQFGVRDINKKEIDENIVSNINTNVKTVKNDDEKKQVIIKPSIVEKANPIYYITNYLPSRDIDEIKVIIENDLTDKQREVIYKKFGLKLDENNNLSSALERGILEISLEKISRIITTKSSITMVNDNVKDKKVLKNIYSHFPGKSLKDIKDIIKMANLSREEERILYKKYGQDLQEVNTLSSEELNTFNVMMRNLREIDMSISLGLEKLLNDDLDKISSEIKNTLFKYDKKELIIFILRLHLTFNDSYKTEDLCDYFNMSEEEINIITKKILLNISADFNKINRLMKYLFNSESKILVGVQSKSKSVK